MARLIQQAGFQIGFDEREGVVCALTSGLSNSVYRLLWGDLEYCCCGILRRVAGDTDANSPPVNLPTLQRGELPFRFSCHIPLISVFMQGFYAMIAITGNRDLVLGPSREGIIESPFKARALLKNAS